MSAFITPMLTTEASSPSCEGTLQDRTGGGSLHRRIGEEQIGPPQDSRGAGQSQRLDDEVPAIPFVLVFHVWLLEVSPSVLAAAVPGIGVRQENLIFGIARFSHAGDAHAALVADGAFVSQIPQPVQRSGFKRGCFTVA